MYLSIEKAAQCLQLLVEGCSLRSTISGVLCGMVISLVFHQYQMALALLMLFLVALMEMGVQRWKASKAGTAPRNARTGNQRLSKQKH
jgi:uncharacterized membrane protein YoaK (UPF0700 family)